MPTNAPTRSAKTKLRTDCKSPCTNASNDGKIMIFAGGIPLNKDGKVVGAVGVSGGSGEQDHAVAEAGASAF